MLLAKLRQILVYLSKDLKSTRIQGLYWSISLYTVISIVTLIKYPQAITTLITTTGTIVVTAFGAYSASKAYEKVRMQNNEVENKSD